MLVPRVGWLLEAIGMTGRIDDDQSVFAVDEVFEELTRFVTLVPGDIVARMTTNGIDPLIVGDTIETDGFDRLEHYGIRPA